MRRIDDEDYEVDLDDTDGPFVCVCAHSVGDGSDASGSDDSGDDDDEDDDGTSSL
jgi:hypothetical protein